MRINPLALHARVPLDMASWRGRAYKPYVKQTRAGTPVRWNGEIDPMTEQETRKVAVADILAEAIAAVNAADVPPELKEAAFSKAVDVIMARHTAETSGQMETGESNHAAPAPPPRAAAITAGDLVGLIATRLRMDRETVAEVFDVADGKIDVIVPPRKLAPGKAPATKQLATLVAAARQGADIEEWTEADEIRRFVEDFKRYDSANFASTLKEMDDIFRIRQTGRKISVKLGRPGWNRAAELVATLAGEA